MLRLTYKLAPIVLLLALSPACDPGGDGDGACAAKEGDQFTAWFDFEEDNPQINGGEVDDGAPVIECDVTGADVDADRLDLACTLAGEAVAERGLKLSPLPAAVSQAITADDPLKVRFRPFNNCSNGCMIEGRGWLEVRRAANDELLVGVVDVRRNLGPIAETLAPVTVSAEPGPCAISSGECQMGASGERQDLEVTVAIAGESVTLVGGEQADVGGYHVLLDRALQASSSACVADGGDASRFELMVHKAP